MRRCVVICAAAALAWPATAPAKEWMTVSGHAGGVVAGQRWDATLKVPTHPDAGPLPREPELVFTHLDTYAQRRFEAEPTGRPGVYRASVVLPTAGKWTIYVYAREIGSASPGPDTNEVVVRAAARNSTWGGGAWAALSLLCVLALAVVTRRAPWRVRRRMGRAS